MASNSLIGVIEQDYTLSGKINKEVEKNTYTGGETSTSRVVVDNVTNIITVDTKIDVEKVEYEIKVANEQYKAFQTRATKIEDDLKTLSKRIDDIGDVIDEKLLPMQYDLNKAKNDIKTLQIDYKSLRNTVNSLSVQLSKEVDELNEKITQLDITLRTEFAKKLEDLEKKINEEISVKLAALEKKINEEIAPKLIELDSKISKESKRAEKVEKEISDEVDILKTKVDGYDEKIDALDKKVDTFDGRITAEVTRANAAEDVIAGNVTKLDAKVTEGLGTLNTKVNKMVTGKAAAMYYDALGELDPEEGKPYWYMSSDIDNCSVETLLKDANGNYVPYDFGTGGGGSSIDVIINQVSWPTVIAFGGDCKVTVNWKAVRDEKQVSGRGVLVAKVNGTTVETKYNSEQGNVTFDIGQYLTEETNTVSVSATFRSAANDTTNSIRTLKLSLESTFNYNRIFSGDVAYTCVPYGTIKKTLHYIVDGVQVGTKDVTVSGDEVTYTFTGWSHGNHTLKVYFDCLVGNELVKSNELFYDLIYVVDGETSPIIATTFNDLQQEQYISFNIPFRVYTPNHMYSDIVLSVTNADGVIVYEQELSVGQEEQMWEYRTDKFGNFTFKIACQEVYRSFLINIKESEIDIKPVTENLKLALGTVGRSNTESPEERQKWQDKERGINCTLTNFNFTSDGWVKDDEGNTVLRVTGDARVDIPYKPFEDDAKILGKTIELEISTSEVMNYESIIMSCMSGNRGFYLTPQLAKIKSQQSELQTQYKEEEHVRLTFVIEKDVQSRIIYMYINGIMCGAVQYPTTDEFRQLTPVNITIGSNDATIDIYNIRVYSNNLNRKQVVNNWIADTQSRDLKMERYYHNDNYNDNGEIVISKLPKDLPYIVWNIDPLPQYKGDKRPGNAEYVDQEDSSRNFTSTDATYNVQGTSSAVYPVKNIRIKYKKNKDWPTTNFTWLDKDGNTITKYTITPDGIGDNYFTYKVDYASSEGANNVELTRLYNDASKSQGILTPPQKQDNKVRVGIDGYPIIAFTKDGLGQVSFCTKANFNNDKANESVYGFAEGDESWEITNNSAAEGNFKKGVTPETFANAFEIRYPDEDGYSDLGKLGPMTNWVASTDPEQATGNEITPIQFTYEEVRVAEDGSYSRVTVVSPVFTNDSAEYRLTKFKAELKDWFNVDSTIFYYIYTLLYLMIDSRAKNAFPTYFAERTPGDGGNRWFWLPYDMDTAIGINNEGKLVFDYNLEDTDKVEGANVFNGQDSVMWNNLRKMFNGEISQMYSNLRTTGGLLSYEETEARFEAHQSKWSESIFNEDAFEKYVVLLDKTSPKYTGDNYLEMLQGSKAEQRKWWLYNRFKYIDSKYLAGESRSDVLQFRAYVPAGTPKPDITITPYADIYATVSYSNGAAGTKSARASRGNPVTIPNPFSLEDDETDQETYIYSASQLKSVGDISPFKPDTVKAANAIRLQELKVGSDALGYTNPNLKELTLGRNTLLKKLDVRNCINLSMAIDVQNCNNLEEVYFDNTKITSLILPSAGIIKKLHLPNTITNLKIRNQLMLEELQIAGTSNVDTLWIENIPMHLIDVEQIINQMPSGAAVRLIGFEKDVDSVQEIKDLYDKLDTMSGIDSQGGHLPKAQVKGIINIETISYAEWKELSDRYKDIEIKSNKIICTVVFYNEGEEFNTQLIIKGNDAANPGIPTKKSDAQYYYDFDKWDKSYKNIQSDLDINAEYTQHIQVYTFKFDPQTTLVDPIPDEKVEYNNLLPKPKDPYIEGAIFNGWFKERATINEFDFTKPVVGPFNPDEHDKPLPITLYGKWTDVDSPVVNVNVISFNKFKFTIKDNIAVTAYAITRTDEEPSDWILITPTSEYVDTYEISESGSYFVWGADAGGHTGKQEVVAHDISRTVAVGATLTLKQGEELVNNFALNGTEILIHADIDSHYENLKLYFNGSLIENNVAKLIEQQSTINVECTPKTYVVKFEIGEHGTPIEDQYIVYNHLVEKPQNQYDKGFITSGWYKEQGLINEWNFNVDKVSEDITLYAKWVVYVEPTIITVIIDENKDIKCNLNQSESNGVKLSWGDGSPVETASGVGDVSFAHRYAEDGKYDIRITCDNGVHYLGKDYSNQAIVPASAVEEIDFAYNMPYTKDYAFRGATSLEHINLTDYMTYVATGAFQDCTKVMQLTIPDNITELKDSCFAGCSGIKGVQVISNNVKKIGTQVFYECSGITEFVLPDDIEEIGNSSFYGCSGLTSFTIPSGITKLSSWLLAGSGITSIDVPETVEEIGVSVFAACPNLRKVILRNKDLIMNEAVFNNNTNLKTAGPIGGDYNIEFAWDVKIPKLAFQYGYTQSYLVEVTLPNTIEEIEDKAFYYCGRLQRINMSNNLKKIGKNVFERCVTLTSISIPKTCTEIGQNAFIRCTGLQRVDLHNTVSTYKVDTYLASWFYLCDDGLIFIHIPSSLKTADDAKVAYGNCWNFCNDGLPAHYDNDLD